MKIIVFFRILYIVIGLLVFITTLDIICNFEFMEEITVLICKDTTGECHWKINFFFMIFYGVGSIISVIFGQSKIAFLVGQIFTLLIYWGMIWIIEKIFKVDVH